ncbi:hypothetical protein B7P43_G08758 [Cryptotermes secundus]|uniref:F-box domain-containing protein n=1 Tax=Cryptotermes secundus TaxID=105785 RepID=A0A2J7RNV4_9NEOP|nr:hypothetical protein B7P43_G08758 [Cryptotermes secundus]
MSETEKSLMETIEEDAGKKSGSSQINITDLPPELLLEIFSWLGVRDLYERVPLVCKKWDILARHPSLWMELSFRYKDIPTSLACKLLHRSPLLRRLILKRRRDSDAILRQVYKSNRRIETIKMISCRGSMRKKEVNGNILKGILEVCPKLFNLELMDTLVKTSQFYRLLGHLDGRLKSFRIDDATENGVRCYLETRTQLLLERRGLLNGEFKDVEDMIDMLEKCPKIYRWDFIFTE